MTSLTAGSTPLDWAGFAVVLAIGVVAVGYSALESRRQPSVYRATRARVQQLIDEALDPVTGPLIWAGSAPETVVETDHETCRNDDCDQILCYCRDQDGPCEGTVEPGCTHCAAFVCDDHRFSDCEGCREDVRWDSAVWPR